MKTPDMPAGAVYAEHRLQVSGVYHRYGQTEVLRGVAFSVEPGEIVCLVGPSGCGKTTLLRLLAGLERLQEGTIRIDGEVTASPMSHIPPEQRDVGLVFQDFALFPHMSLLENVAFGLSKHPRGRRREMAQHMLERVGLAARGNDLPHRLSGGQQQRVALARAMAPRPRLLLLDEPFSNLDVRLRHRTRLDTLRLLKDSHTSSILVTHDPDEAMFMADRIALMQEGRIVQLGSPADLYRHPASPFAALFFGDLNRIAGVVRNGMVATPVGEFDAGSMTDGTAVEVLVRPESIQAVAGTSTGIAARVTSCRMLGSMSLLGLRIVTQDAQTFDLQAQVAGSEAFNEDSPLHIRVDSQGVFVFPAASADDQVP